MICAEIRVFGNAASEFGEYHYDDIVRASDTLEIGDERRYGIRGVGEQALVQVALEHMCIESIVTVGDVIQPGRKTGMDERRDFRKIQTRNSVVHWRLVARPCLLDLRGCAFRASRNVEKKPS